MTDTRERFLREIAERIPAERIVEVHLFRPMRRGAAETGVAVIAALPDVAGPELDVADVKLPDPEIPERTKVTEVTSEARTMPVVETVARIPIVVDATAETVEPPLEDASPYADDYAAAFGLIETISPDPATATPAHPERHTVFTARYRLTIKGPERGKWEFDVVADADAPLVTVDTVVRGVQRRAGDDDDPERLTAESLRAALDGQSWRATT